MGHESHSLLEVPNGVLSCRLTPSLDCQPWKHIENRQLFWSWVNFANWSLNTHFCVKLSHTVMSFSVTIKYVWNSGALSTRGPLDFVHPCPMVVTPLSLYQLMTPPSFLYLAVTVGITAIIMTCLAIGLIIHELIELYVCR